MKKKIVLGEFSRPAKNPMEHEFSTIRNNNTAYDFNIRITVPEFTALCPVTQQPDFATIIIDYVPKKVLLESKSFKLYIQSFRNFGIFHEEATLLIAKNLKKSLNPKWLRISGYFAPRGGIPIDVFWQSNTVPKKVFIPDIPFKLLNIYR